MTAVFNAAVNSIPIISIASHSLLPVTVTFVCGTILTILTIALTGQQEVIVVVVVVSTGGRRMHDSIF